MSASQPARAPRPMSAQTVQSSLAVPSTGSARPASAGRPVSSEGSRPGSAGAPQGSPKRVKYKGGRDAKGLPHGMGLLLTESIYYKGQFENGKFCGRGLMRRFGPPGSASTTPSSDPHVDPAAAKSRELESALTGPLSTPPGDNTITPPQSARGAAASDSPGSTIPLNRGSRAAVWTYFGTFDVGKRHGYGKILFHRTGEHYEGDWADDHMKGFGTYSLPSTGRYVGAMHGNRRHGIGTMIYIDRSGYRGHWVQDVIHGGGRLVEPDGTYYDGQWKRGVMNGTFHVTKPSGSVYRRQFLDGRQVLSEKLKERDLYQKIFESRPEVVSTEQRLAEVFKEKMREQAAATAAADAAAAANEDGTDGEPTETRDTLRLVPSMRRPTTAPVDATSKRRPSVTVDTGLALEDADHPDEVDGDDADAQETPAQDAMRKASQANLEQSRSFVRPLNETIDMLSPRSLKRPHTADARPTRDSDDEDAGSASPSSPVHHRAGSRHPKARAAEELDAFGNVSPNATLVATQSHSTSAAASPRGVGTTMPATDARGDALSPRSQANIDRMTKALLAEAEKLGDAPVPAGAPDAEGDAEELTLEDLQKQRQEAELDRRASLAIMRAHSQRAMSRSPSRTSAASPRGRKEAAEPKETRASERSVSPSVTPRASMASGVQGLVPLANDSLVGAGSFAGGLLMPSMTSVPNASFVDNTSFISNPASPPTGPQGPPDASKASPRDPSSPPVPRTRDAGALDSVGSLNSVTGPSGGSSRELAPADSQEYHLPKALRLRESDDHSEDLGGTASSFAGMDLSNADASSPPAPPKLPELPPPAELCDRLVKLNQHDSPSPNELGRSTSPDMPMGRERSRSVRFDLSPSAGPARPSAPVPVNPELGDASGSPSSPSMRTTRSASALIKTPEAASPKHGRRAAPAASSPP